MRAWAVVGLLLVAVYTALIIPFSPRRHPVITPSSPPHHPLITPSSPCRRHPAG